MKSQTPTKDKRTSAQARIKGAALKLFAEHGYRNVTVRDIANAAGQKNHAAVGYYFASKENLAREILVDGAAIIEARRKSMLDAMENSDKPPTVRQLVEALLLPSVEVRLDYAPEQLYFARLTQDLSLNEPELFDDTLRDRWNAGYQQCLKLLRTQMPKMSTSEANRRFIFLGAYLGTIGALRESKLADQTRQHKVWHSDETLHDIIETAAAILQAPLPRSARSASPG